jgi:hypothetical protein
MTQQQQALAQVPPAAMAWAIKQDQISSLIGKKNPVAQHVLDLAFQPQLEAAKANALIAPHLQEHAGKTQIDTASSYLKADVNPEVQQKLAVAKTLGEKQAVLLSAGINPASPEGQAAMRNALPDTRPELQRNAEFVNPGNVAAQQGAVAAGMPNNTPDFQARVQSAKTVAEKQAILQAAGIDPNSPQGQNLLGMGAAHGAGIEPVIGGTRAGVPARQYNLATGKYDMAFQTPHLGQGEIQNPDGSISLAPGAVAAATTMKGAESGAVDRAKAEQEQRQKVINEANAAQQSRATLMSMANEAGKFVQGPFAQHAQTAASYLRLINPDYNEQVGAYEDFVKNAGSLTRQAVKEVSSRAAVQEFNLIQSTLPNPDMSPLGLQRVQNELVGLSDYKIAKSQAQEQWEGQHGGPGNVAGFETAWQKQASPYAFIVSRMASEDRQQMIAKLQSSDAGRKELARLGEQLQFLKQSGLAQ